MLEGGAPERGPDAELEPVDAAVSNSISRVCEALYALLGPAAVGDDLFSAPPRRRKAEAGVVAEAAASTRDRLTAEADQRAAAMAELVAMSFEPILEPGVRLTGQTRAAALAELGASASNDVPEPVAAGSAAAPVADDDDDDDDDELTQTYGDRDTDTAALLRELTSLGIDDEAPASQLTRRARSTAPRPASAAAHKKRKGLFGRG